MLATKFARATLEALTGEFPNLVYTDRSVAGGSECDTSGVHVVEV
jgi:hypothetical protein